MAGARTDDMRGDDEPRSFHQAAIERVTQVDSRPFRINAAKIAQRRKAVAHVFAREAQPHECLGRRRLQRLRYEVCGVHSQMNVGVDEAGAHGPIGKIDHSCT